VLRAYMAHAKTRPGVRFATARDLPQIYAGPLPPKADPAAVKRHLANGITFLETPDGALSAAELLQVLLEVEPGFVEGPEVRRESTYSGASVPRPAFERAKRDAADFIRTRKALPAMVWVGSQYLSLPDFTATLAAEEPGTASVPVRKGRLLFEKYFATDARAAFNWAIHPEGFAPAELLELGRLQGWTLKPARLR
jgi:hypothetical protein